MTAVMDQMRVIVSSLCQWRQVFLQLWPLKECLRWRQLDWCLKRWSRPQLGSISTPRLLVHPALVSWPLSPKSQLLSTFPQCKPLSLHLERRPRHQSEDSPQHRALSSHQVYLQWVQWASIMMKIFCDFSQFTKTGAEMSSIVGSTQWVYTRKGFSSTGNTETSL